ncbi:unnamed protein product, partial [Hapterophycus canaliculatus]
VRSWKGDRHSVAYTMQPISDMNEVTMHTLEIIYTHLFNTKGALPGKAAVGGGAAVAQPMNGVGSPGFHGSSSQQGFTSPSNNMSGGNMSSNQADAKGFSTVQQKVHDMFLGSNDEQGRSIKDVAGALQSSGSGISFQDVS